MKKYKCLLCGYVYDPAVGDPDNGVEPGTDFEDLPDDWVCPECGADKDEFEPIEDQLLNFGIKEMQEVDLSILRQDIICAETPAGPTGMVVFGASGDLVRRKLLVSLFRLFKQSLLSEDFFNSDKLMNKYVIPQNGMIVLITIMKTLFSV